MSATESAKFEGILGELKGWPSSERVRLARMILETVEAPPASALPRQGSLKDLLGILKTNAPSPTDDECRATFEEELIRKNLK
jgi:hypothetical protein